MSFLVKKPENVQGSALPAILIGAFVAFGGVLYGYDTGTIGGILAMKYWRKLFSTGYINPKDGLPDVDASQTSEIVSILSAGTFFGALLSAPIADRVGRRWGLIIDCLVFTFGVIIQTAAAAIPMFVAGRFFAGLGVGLLSATIPLYQSETAPKWIRGTIVGCYQVSNSPFRETLTAVSLIGISSGQSQSACSSRLSSLMLLKVATTQGAIVFLSRSSSHGRLSLSVDL